MKRFLSLLTVFMLAFALAVPVGAVDEVVYMKYNDYELPDIESVWTDKENYPYAVILHDDRYSPYWTKLLLCSVAPTYENSSFIFADFKDYDLNGDEWLFTQNYEGRQSRDTWLLKWSLYDVKDLNGNVKYSGSSPKGTICDGASCPATDANIDGICDDCGMMLSLRSLTYPAFPSVDGANKHYALVKTKYSGVDAYMYSVFISDVTYDIRGETPSTVYQIAVDGVADYSQYVTTDGQTWVEIQNSSVNNQSVGSGIVSQTTVIASTFDWYNEDGDRFFPVPLWEGVQTVTQGEMGNLTAKTAGTLKVLVPCGVGLMACLVALSLFGKRSLISLR